MLYFERYARVQDVLDLKENEDPARSGILTCPLSASLTDLIAYMDDYKIGAVYLDDTDGQVKGVVSERDIIHHLAMYDLKAFEKPISSFMCADLIFCRHDDPLKRVASFMAEKRIRHIAVKDGEGRIIGVVSARDIERFAGNG
ncbi:CBS domain-containing protein [Terasakiella pusilla]|uniref:CBS domain-containing protein n=1 Tax=Terasakiella pusilla TaxID=64973 RepID=UPI003AA7D7F3